MDKCFTRGDLAYELIRVLAVSMLKSVLPFVLRGLPTFMLLSNFVLLLFLHYTNQILPTLSSLFELNILTKGFCISSRNSVSESICRDLEV